MTDCEFCHRPLLKEEDTIQGLDQHKKCFDEIARRAGNNICTKCGSYEIRLRHDWCDKCDINSEYKNLPGGSI